MPNTALIALGAFFFLGLLDMVTIGTVSAKEVPEATLFITVAEAPRCFPPGGT